MFKNTIIFLLFLFLTCCSFKPIQRWPDKYPEIENARFSIQIQKNIFDDYLWTTPSMNSQRLVVLNGKAEVNFAGRMLSFAFGNDGKITLTEPEDTPLTRSAESSGHNYYYDYTQLSFKPVVRERWTHKTVFVRRPVHDVSPMFGTMMIFGPGRRHRAYSRTGIYFGYEVRTVPETRLVWEKSTDRMIDIPEFTLFRFPIDNDRELLIYKVDTGKGDAYYLQNPSYYLIEDKEIGYFGKKGINVLFVDANSNGRYFETSDRVLLNTWNPYEKESRYVQLPGLMHNHWYSLENLEKERFLKFIEQDGALTISSENSRYINNPKKGKVKFENVKGCTLFLNGRRYYSHRSVFEKGIQYGKYKLRIEKSGYLDFEDTFLIDENTGPYKLKYHDTTLAGIVKIENIKARDWLLTYTEEGEEEKHFHKRNRISLPAGNVVLRIYAGGFDLSRTFNIIAGEVVIWDYGADLEKMKTD